MKLKVRLFAGAKDIAGAEGITVELADHGTISDLRIAIAELHPRLTGLLDRCAFAVNSEFADDGTTVPEGAEVAVLPPVSGG